MWIAISNIADKFKLKVKRLLYDLGPEVWEPPKVDGRCRQMPEEVQGPQIQLTAFAGGNGTLTGHRCNVGI